MGGVGEERLTSWHFHDFMCQGGWYICNRWKSAKWVPCIMMMDFKSRDLK